MTVMWMRLKYILLEVVKTKIFVQKNEVTKINNYWLSLVPPWWSVFVLSPSLGKPLKHPWTFLHLLSSPVSSDIFITFDLNNVNGPTRKLPPNWPAVSELIYLLRNRHYKASGQELPTELRVKRRKVFSARTQPSCGARDYILERKIKSVPGLVLAFH